MTAEPRAVEDWCGSPVSHEPHPGCSGWPSAEARDFIETAKILAEPYNEKIAALEARLAAADRENAELRAAILRNVDTHADLSTQLAAAQAQLAEFDRECYERSLEQQDALARLEAVRGYIVSARAPEATDHAAGWNLALAAVEKTLAALSAAPQPEPDDAPYETPEEAAANDTIPAEPISPEFRHRLIAAIERPLRVRRAILLLAGHASGHLPGFDRGCRVCRRDWPCEDTQRAAGPALEAFGDATPEPPASDEPARCEHGFTAWHWVEATARCAEWRCSGPAASDAPR